jgi:uncharacterized damage-inducible protein DinB
MIDPINKTELIARMKRQHQRLTAFLALLTDEQQLLSGACGYWSVKDVLNHLTFWDEYTINSVKTFQSGQLPADYARPGEPRADAIERTNTEGYEATKHLTLPETLAAQAAVHERAYALVESTPESSYESRLFGEARKATVIGYLYGTLAEHYDEHLIDLEKWRETLSG